MDTLRRVVEFEYFLKAWLMDNPFYLGLIVVSLLLCGALAAGRNK